MGGARDIVDESCGIFVATTGPKAVGRALRSLIEDDRRRALLAAAAPARAHELCDPALRMRELAETIARLRDGVSAEKPPQAA
jgi:hypothetical protein